MNNLRLVKESLFGSIVCDYYGDGKGDFYMTREQIGRALEYKYPQNAIDKIHAKHKERLDKFSIPAKLADVGGRLYETSMYSARGIYEIIRYSSQPKADDFYDHVYDILEGLRTGYMKLIIEKQTPAWKDTREQAREIRKAETDCIQEFVEYARDQGSQNADRYYRHFSYLADKAAGITDRDNSTLPQLNCLVMVEQIISHCIREGMGQNEPYHDVYQRCKRRVEEFKAIALIA